MTQQSQQSRQAPAPERANPSPREHSHRSYRQSEWAARLASRADDLIDRALSSDSRRFLDATRQTGGE